MAVSSLNDLLVFEHNGAAKRRRRRRKEANELFCCSLAWQRRNHGRCLETSTCLFLGLLPSSWHGASSRPRLSSDIDPLTITRWTQWENSDTDIFSASQQVRRSSKLMNLNGPSEKLLLSNFRLLCRCILWYLEGSTYTFVVWPNWQLPTLNTTRAWWTTRALLAFGRFYWGYWDRIWWKLFTACDV